MSGFTKPVTSKFIPLDGGVDEYHSADEMPANRLQGNGKTSNIHIDNGKLQFRPRKDLWGLAFTNDFEGVHEYIDADGNARLLVGSNGSVYESTTTANTARDSGLNVEDLHFHTHRKRCWYNGATSQRKITGTTAARVGLPAPVDAPTVAKAGTGLTGSYAWKYTFVIKESGVKVWESDPSPVSDSVTCANEGVTVTLPASPDARVNCRRVYRTSASGAVYQEEGDVDNNTEGATFSSGSVTDANLGDIAETNHGVPVQGFVSEGCNERMFWLVNSTGAARLYYSEQAITEAYQEYQVSTNYKELPAGGLGVGIKRLYNKDTARDDLYVFQERGVSLLQNGDPNNPLVRLSDRIGCEQHDTICEYNGMLIFLSSEGTVCAIAGNQIIDISSRSWPVSIAALLTKERCRGAIIFKHYYAMTCRSSAGKAYNHTAWVCDLRKIKLVENNQADAVWYPWEIDAEYLLQRVDGTVLMFSNKDYRIYQLSFSIYSDDTAAGGTETVTAIFATKDFGSDSLNMNKAVKVLYVKGKQENNLSVQMYYGTAFTMQRSGGAVFIVGSSLMGSQLTQTPVMLSTSVPLDNSGTFFNFAFTKNNVDRYFEIEGLQFTYSGFVRM